MFVFTPKGAVVALPVGSTPVDFAYAVHTEVGHHCIGGRVNGRLAPLDSVLENGDSVEILTSKADGAGPSRDWLAFVKSPRARNKIRQWFTKERREEAIEQGKDAIAKYLRKQGHPLHRLMSAESLTAVAGDLRYSDIDSLFAAVGDSNVSAQHVVSRPWRPWAGRSPPARISPKPRSRHGPVAVGFAAVIPGLSLSAPTTCGSRWPAAARRSRGRDHRLHHPRQRGVGAP